MVFVLAIDFHQRLSNTPIGRRFIYQNPNWAYEVDGGISQDALCLMAMTVTGSNIECGIPQTIAQEIEIENRHRSRLNGELICKPCQTPTDPGLQYIEIPGEIKP
jgi:hypothetical protein